MSILPPDSHLPQFASRFSRRELLRFGLTGFAGLTLPGLYRLRGSEPAPNSRRRTAVILVWLRGGPSHLETFDPKPESPLEYRGPYQPIATNVNGIQICELLPKLAQIADRYSILRSMAHTGGGHPAGSLQVLSGDPDAADKPHPVFPDWMSVANYARRDPGQQRALPNYVGVHPVTNYDNFVIAGPTYLGPAYGPFTVYGDPSHPNFRVPNVGLERAEEGQRFSERVALRRQFEEMQRQIEQTSTMDALDQFQQQALNLLTSPQSREAFDLSREPDAIRDQYGRHAWGQQCLLARRLVEAGVDIVATEFSGPQCARVHNWDDHAVNHHVFEALKFRLPSFDQAVAALIHDVYERGLDREVLIVVGGEFGRTPRISYAGSSGGGVASGTTGTVQPGRDHWPAANSMIFAGGGLRTGQVIGATDVRGEQVVERRASPGDFLATIYQHLGIDLHLAIPDFTGRPIPILREGQPIAELTA